MKDRFEQLRGRFVEIKTVAGERVKGTIAEVGDDHAVLKDLVGGSKYIAFSAVAMLEDQQGMKEKVDELHRGER